jgi:AcrR family transcriptional regulator
MAAPRRAAERVAQLEALARAQPTREEHLRQRIADGSDGKRHKPRVAVDAQSPPLARKPKRVSLREQFRKLVSPTHERRGKPDRRRTQFVRIGRQMLEMDNYDRMTVAAVVREAHCSVGAFYTRFANKSLFIDALIADAFHAALGELAPPDDAPKGQTAARIATVRFIVDSVLNVAQQNAGALRAAIKRSHIAPAALAPVLAYRQAVTDQAVHRLVPRLCGANPEQAVRVAMQVLHATVTDACLCPEKILPVHSTVLLDQLVHMIAQYLSRRPSAHRRA